jgi:hypothetical protein
MQTHFQKELNKLSMLKDAGSFHLTKLATLEILSELYFIEGNTRKALQYYLMIGSEYEIDILDDMSNSALQQVLKDDLTVSSNSKVHCRYKHLLSFIRSNELHKVLLESEIGEKYEMPPLVALLCLVGLRYAGQFIVDHCVLPDSKGYATQVDIIWFPLDLVTSQLKNYPKLMLWFLHNVLCNRPEIYVNFPNTAVPPTTVTKLHKIHFDLLVTFDNKSISPKRKLSDIPSFDELKKESSMLKFLKVSYYKSRMILHTL